MQRSGAAQTYEVPKDPVEGSRNEHDANEALARRESGVYENVLYPDFPQRESAKTQSEPVVEEVTLGGEAPPEPDLVVTPQDRGRIRAIKNISALEQAERAAAQPTKPSLWGRVKGWFSRAKEDDRTLSERMAEIEAAELMEQARKKLVMDPAALTKQELVLLSDEDMLKYLEWKKRDKAR